ncbi:type VII secretion target [Mycobacterium sp. 050128]|uniref:type VII secretion target n=1 Tax=Mycobacterium sp. 050128 TaxID=3096112 RepID=UPI002ED7A8F5
MMNLNVDPTHLANLAKRQDAVAATAVNAAKTTDTVAQWLWITHGVISWGSNIAGGGLVNQRRAAGLALAKAAADLSAKLRAAEETYQGVDGELRENLDDQAQPK